MVHFLSLLPTCLLQLPRVLPFVSFAHPLRLSSHSHMCYFVATQGSCSHQEYVGCLGGVFCLCGVWTHGGLAAVKRVARLVIEKYYPRLTLDFHSNKRVADEIVSGVASG